MKPLFLVVVFVIHFNALAQFRSDPSQKQYLFNYPILPLPQKTFIHGLISDPVQNYRQISPVMTNYSSLNWQAQNVFFWAGSVTTMSFNKGRFGTFYYWDVQGNLRGARGFIDLSGKNKRGFKLVFPWKKF